MAPSQQLQRQWSLVRLLCARRFGCTVRELADELNMSQKSIRRDLQTLTAAGFPLSEEVERHGRKRWRLASDSGVPSLTFTFEEAASLHLGHTFLEPLAGTVFWEGSRQAFRKIRTTLGDSALRYLEKMATAVHRTSNGRCDYSRRAELIDGLMLAVEEQRIAFVTYLSARATESVTHELYPYGLVWHRHALYLVAFAPEHDEIRHYKVDRVDDVDVQTLRFNRPNNFDLEAHLQNAFGIYVTDGPVCRARIRFLPSAAKYVREHAWHPSQTLSDQRDGSVIAEFQLSDLTELKSWILSFGASAVVEKPDELRNEIVDTARAVLESYQFTGSGAKRAE